MTHGSWKTIGSSRLSFASFYWSSTMNEPCAVIGPGAHVLHRFPIPGPSLSGGGGVARLGRSRLGNQEPRDPGERWPPGTTAEAPQGCEKQQAAILSLFFVVP